VILFNRFFEVEREGEKEEIMNVCRLFFVNIIDEKNKGKRRKNCVFNYY